MAFPTAPAPANLQQHTEGNKNYIFDLATGVWLVEDLSGAGATNLSAAAVTATTVDVASSTGTDATIPGATGVAAGVMSAADKAKADTVETNAAADQIAAEVPYSNVTSGLVATDTQAAIDEVEGRLDAIGDIGNHVGQATTSALLDAIVDPNGGGVPDNGDTAYLTVDEGGRQAGFYIRTGGAWPATPFFQLPDAFASAASKLSDNLLGVDGAAATYAPSDHRHAQSRGAALPALDGTGGIDHVLQGHATLPDGKYVLIASAWVQV